MKQTTFTRSELLNKFKTKEFQFIPYEGLVGNTLSFPSFLLSLDKVGSTCVEITSFVDGFKLTQYLVCNCPIIVESCDIDYDSATLVFSNSWDEKPKTYLYAIPDETILYSSCSLDDWKEAIEMGYNMVKDLHKKDSIYFTYSDVYKKVTGRNGDLGLNIRNGVNAKLKDKSINLYGMNRGSHVCVTCECEKCLKSLQDATSKVSGSTEEDETDQDGSKDDDSCVIV